MIFRILPFLLLLSCSVVQEPTPAPTTQAPMTQLHDIWALRNIEGEALPADISQIPVLEIFVADKKIQGNDGCNSLSGPIKILNETEIVFGRMMSTKKACPNMQFSSRYTQLLEQTTHFKVEKMNLVLFDVHERELLRFQKVD